MPGDALSLSERVQIEMGVGLEQSARTIAARMGRPPSTVTRELERNGGRDAYSAAAADARAANRRRRPRLTCFQRDPVLADHVEARLAAKDSPMTISKELARGVFPEVEASVSHETIYNGIYAHGKAGLVKGLHRHLHRSRRCRTRRRPPGDAVAKDGPLGSFNLIFERPPEADDRSEVGHLEGDLIIGSFNRSAIVTVFDRLSRLVWLADLPEGHGADPTLAALVEILERIPGPLRRSLTWDQGREMARHHDLAAMCGIDVFFAEPHSPWQRPTNENGNGLLRRYVGKGTNLNVYTPADLRAIEDRLNTMPRRSLGWATAAEVYAANSGGLISVRGSPGVSVM